MPSALLTGLLIGLAAGVSPGPLLVLVITATLRDGWRAGLATAASPLLSDLVVVAAVLLTLGQLPQGWLDWLGIVGGLAVVLVGVQTALEARTATIEATRGDDNTPQARRSLLRGALVNLLSPHPWITWVTVLGPLTLQAWRAHPAGGVVLVLGFYAALVGSKAVLAALVGQGRGRLTTSVYRKVLVVAGAVLVLFGIAMGVEFGTKVL